MIPPDCVPKTEDEVVIRIKSGPDSLGRYSFDLFWRTNYIAGHPNPEPRMTQGQCCCGLPDYYYGKFPNIREVDHSPTGEFTKNRRRI